MAKLKIKHKQSNVFSPTGTYYGSSPSAGANVVVDAGYPFSNTSANGGGTANSLVFSTIGVVGGANALGSPTGTTGASNVILCIANICFDGNVSNAVAGDAFIVAQKGKHKFLVANLADPTQQQVCLLANVDDGNASNLTGTTANLGVMAIQAVDATSANIAIYAITDKHAWGFPPDYANANSQGNLANANQYYTSYANANATVQPGPGAGAGTASSAGLFPIVSITSIA